MHRTRNDTEIYTHTHSRKHMARERERERTQCCNVDWVAHELIDIQCQPILNLFISQQYPHY